MRQEINLTPEAKHGSQMWGGFPMDSLITDANDVTLAFEDYKLEMDSAPARTPLLDALRTAG
ncbi:MAG: hypothetical protein E5X61_06880 [Mesorhizobium sp.]|nr:MAG: hypothetical protein E5X61_06880 [Mesorhizobium sp.]